MIPAMYEGLSRELAAACRKSETNLRWVDFQGNGVLLHSHSTLRKQIVGKHSNVSQAQTCAKVEIMFSAAGDFVIIQRNSHLFVSVFNSFYLLKSYF